MNGNDHFGIELKYQQHLKYSIQGNNLSWQEISNRKRQQGSRRNLMRHPVVYIMETWLHQKQLFLIQLSRTQEWSNFILNNVSENMSKHIMLKWLFWHVFDVDVRLFDCSYLLFYDKETKVQVIMHVEQRTIEKVVDVHKGFNIGLLLIG